ncbi:amino acid synthesis family protein [Leucobacter weissii]|uniref:Amino acid synthesis family protein n=1 Tax=Leucobacter weissii TaxID=1983706 RepID=A0A939MJK2_9MICO|nr:amino acid synthesis family protein [Leucobacter weissii]MBO1901741.1 amino acid synthesis family protein [Leucobacter weissii]
MHQELTQIVTAAGTVPVRKTVIHLESVVADGGRAVERPVHRAVVGAVLRNPFAGVVDDELELLQEAGGVFGEWAMTVAVGLLPGEVKAYGKAGVVGESGELEHVAALLHPRFGGPTREIAGGISILPSVKKRGGTGCTVDIPVHHKTAMKIRDYFDSVTVSVADAPLSDELLLLLAVTDGPRPHPRMGGLREADAVGEDGVN